MPVDRLRIAICLLSLLCLQPTYAALAQSVPELLRFESTPPASPAFDQTLPAATAFPFGLKPDPADLSPAATSGMQLMDVLLPATRPTSASTCSNQAATGRAPPTSLWASSTTPFGVWGAIGASGYFAGQRIAPNGLEYNQLFSIDLDFNIWVQRQYGVYLFTDTSFRAQAATPGVTNASQGAFDFSKREYDLSGGVAWNYHGPLELRAFAYSYNNLNRGNSKVDPSGYNDGAGIENRFYYTPTYRDLGTPTYDLARSGFVSLGYYPTKTLVDAQGNAFRPGLFAHAYSTYDLYGPRVYVYGDAQLTCTRSFSPRLLNLDLGVAVRPLVNVPRLELRLGVQGNVDIGNRDNDAAGYGSIRYLFD